ncbi:MAG: hypothetical protein J6U38_04815 [Clostridia bacterium]|jgi:hypothetical protein|nr:hypothetical protein [Clostridia bacterium]MBO7398808.1 hypothetical protein [Clostridia bacterium]MBO7503671.1 hypothetical protein [Clostridia bacterium]MBO7658188.1 hypothetical protein [Clostridia bacterium]MBP5664680.1 hypothetical protein [Clostridia bacterium]
MEEKSKKLPEKVCIVINGRGGCGKDTLCDICASRYPTVNVSSITPIKEIARLGGWNGEKDPKSRKFLADLKQLFRDYNDLGNVYVLNALDAFLKSDNAIIFVHIRESDEIAKFVSDASKKCRTVTLLVDRHTGDYSNDSLGNASDDNVADYNYDFVFLNDAPTLEILSEKFMSYLENEILVFPDPQKFSQKPRKARKSKPAGNSN